MITLADKLENGKVGAVLDDSAAINSPMQGQDADVGFDGGIMGGMGGMNRQRNCSEKDRPLPKLQKKSSKFDIQGGGHVGQSND